MPVCLWLVLKTLNDGPNMDIKWAFIYVALLGVTSVIQGASTQHYNYTTELWGLKLKVALIGLVYKKVTQLVTVRKWGRREVIQKGLGLRT